MYIVRPQVYKYISDNKNVENKYLVCMTRFWNNMRFWKTLTGTIKVIGSNQYCIKIKPYENYLPEISCSTF